MKYFTIERNKISNIYKATEVSIRRFSAYAGFKLSLPDEVNHNPMLHYRNGKLVIIYF